MAPHQLDLRGLALQPQAKVVKILVKLSRLERSLRMRCPGSPRTLHVPAEEFPQPGHLHRIVNELVIEISGK